MDNEIRDTAEQPEEQNQAESAAPVQDDLGEFDEECECVGLDCCGIPEIPERCRDWLTSVAPVTLPNSRMLASPEQITDNYLALLESIHDEDALHILELRHWWQFRSRHRMKQELQFLYAGLWHLALHRSFPQDYEAIFAVWEERTAQHMSRSRRAAWSKRLHHYVAFMDRYGDRDFRALSRHITAQVYTEKAQIKRVAFGMALHIRRIYTFLFEHLV